MRGGQEEPPTVGGLSVRANVADREDLRLVPGEYLNELDPHYFDSRGNPPEEQVLEKLYYQPCAGCGRPSNDPLCRCSERPAVAT
jgi:hypothetical protein